MENFKIKRNIKAFDGDRYSVWKLRLRALLTELDVIKVIDNVTPDEITDEWNRAERIAKNVIVEYLSDSFLGFAKGEHTAKEILHSLDIIYERKSLATQLALRKKLLGLKIQSDTTLLKHFTIFDDLITELLVAGAKLEETDKVSHLLLTLPTSYDGVITAIETLTEDNLTLAFVKTRLLDHEVKLTFDSRDTSTKVLHAEIKDVSATKKRNFVIPRPSKNYRKGQYRARPHKFHKKSFSIKCHHCGRIAHIKNDCYYYKRELKFQNAEKNRTVQTVQVTEPLTSVKDTSGFAFMAGECQYETEKKIIFLLDSGASDHLINRKDLADSFDELQTPMKISVAKNGAFINATKKGSVHVISNMGIQGVLEDVLYCPEVPYNLLSVRRMQQAGMTIIFNKNGVEINKGGKVVMRGKPLNNLFSIDFMINMNKVSPSAQVCGTVNSNYQLWHQRLGHIGKSKFLELKNKQMIDDIDQIDRVTPNDNLCEACINGKQARLPFEKVKK